MRRGRESRARYPMSAFLDSSGLYALLDRTDAHHAEAVRLFRQLSSASTHLYLTNFIRAEAHALILNRLGHAVADRFLAELRGMPPDHLIRITEADEEAALTLVSRYQDKDFSLTDATSFVVMERLGIRHAFTFDSDYRQFGWAILTAL